MSETARRVITYAHSVYHTKLHGNRNLIPGGSYVPSRAGADNENRTRISSLGNWRTDHCTIPA